jgi:hypothetical protein
MPSIRVSNLNFGRTACLPAPVLLLLAERTSPHCMYERWTHQAPFTIFLQNLPTAPVNQPVAWRRGCVRSAVPLFLIWSTKSLLIIIVVTFCSKPSFRGFRTWSSRNDVRCCYVHIHVSEDQRFKVAVLRFWSYLAGYVLSIPEVYWHMKISCVRIALYAVLLSCLENWPTCVCLRNAIT